MIPHHYSQLVKNASLLRVLRTQSWEKPGSDYLGSELMSDVCSQSHNSVQATTF